MHIKFETSSSTQVRGLAFHPRRCWVLASYSDGILKLWDYTTNSLVEEFRGHRGPIRGLHFHPQQSIFASGGDDCKVKVWNSETRKLSFTLTGHEDYIRSIHFHAQHPWLVSSSDDCTAKIWNWQSRCLVATVTGHAHWVTSATPHPTLDLLLTTSVDNTVRVWDYSSLRARTCSAGAGQEETVVHHLFGVLDVVSKHVWELFSAQVKLALFHPSRPLVCVADGRVFRLFHLESGWEVMTMLGHGGDISGAEWVSGPEPWMNCLVSVGGDKTVRTWDCDSGLCVSTEIHSRKIHSLVKHPTKLLLASLQDKDNSQDNSFIVFKLWKQRPSMTVFGHHVYFTQAGTLVHYNCDREKETVLVKIPGTRNSRVNSISYNSSQHSVIVNSSIRNTKHTYQLFVMVEGGQNVKPKIKSSPGRSAVWASTNRFACLGQENALVIKNLDNQNVNFGGFAVGFLLKKTEVIPNKTPNCDTIFPGFANGHVLLWDSNTKSLTEYDTLKRRRIASLSVQAMCKQVYWTTNGTMLAVISKHDILLCNSKLKCVSRYKSRLKIKSGAWCNASGVFLYTTPSQLRYIMASGHEGLIKTLPDLLYLALVGEQSVIGFTRDGKLTKIDVNTEEYRFRAAVIDGKEDEVLTRANSGKIIGQSQLQFLRDAGHPKIALHFIQDPKTRFCLSMESCDLSSALEAADNLQDKICWNRLADLSLLSGNIKIAETCYQRSRSYSKLAFLYTITGQMEKLKRLVKVMGVVGDGSGQYQAALVLGDVKARVALLEKAGLGGLASLTAEVHGLKETQAGINENLLLACEPRLLEPSPPIVCMLDNWPTNDEES